MSQESRGQWFASAMQAIARRLPFGLSEVIPPNVVGYLIINGCTFGLDLGLLAVFHGDLKIIAPVAVTMSYGTASLVSYTLNRILNFQSHGAVGTQLPLYVAAMVTNYLMFVLGLFDLLVKLGVQYEFSRILAACCEGVFLYCCMRWLVFRDAMGNNPVGPHHAAEAADSSSSSIGSAGPMPASPMPASEPLAGEPRPAVPARPEAR